MTRDRKIELYNELSPMSIEQIDAFIKACTDTEETMYAVEFLSRKRKLQADAIAGRW